MYKVNTFTIFDESKENILSLGKGSDKRVRVCCPYCHKKRTSRFSAVVNTGTYCPGCKKLEKGEQELVGKTVNGIFVLSAAKPHVDKNGKRFSMIKCRCFCGKIFTARTNYIKRNHTRSCGCLASISKEGKKNPNFNHKKTKKDRELEYAKRRNPEYRKWRKDVLSHFGRCFLCGETKGLEVHHINSFQENEELRYDKQNGVCLCTNCHRKYHTTFLGGYSVLATKQSFQRFMEWLLWQ